MGVWPRGAQVRRTSGWSMKPLSSTNTRDLPARRAFFYMRPALGPPAPDGRFVALLGAALRLLAAPPLAAQDLPDMGGVVPDTTRPRDDLGDAGQRPEI